LLLLLVVAKAKAQAVVGDSTVNMSNDSIVVALDSTYHAIESDDFVVNTDVGSAMPIQ
jgi:hypothetical protein